jgi:hypothetical protein
VTIPWRRFGTTYRVSSSRVMNMGSWSLDSWDRQVDPKRRYWTNITRCLIAQERAQFSPTSRRKFEFTRIIRVSLILWHRTTPLRHAILSKDIYWQSRNGVRFEVIKEPNIKITNFWDVKSFTLVYFYHIFGDTSAYTLGHSSCLSVSYLATF